MRACRQGHASGFTMIEAIVALLIVALVAGVFLFEVMRGGWQAMSGTASENLAISIARSELAKAGIEWPLTGLRRSGVSQSRFNYDVEAIPRPEEGGRPPMTYTVSVVVRWNDAPGKPRIVRLETIKLAGGPL